jgi:hypothetical protein
LVLFIAPIWAEPQVALPQNRVKVYGVERYRPSDKSDYDNVWEKTLKQRNLHPLVYSTKQEMVDLVVGDLSGNDCIEELNLYGHGRPGLFCLGRGQSSDRDPATFIVWYEDSKTTGEWQTVLRPLKKKLCSGATVNLIGCNVGAEVAGAKLLFALSQFLEATVRGPVNLVIGGEDYDKHKYPTWQIARPEVKERPKEIPAVEKPE